MEMIVHVPHVPHNMGRGNECPYHNHHYNQIEIPVWAFLFWAVVVIVVLKIILYIDDKINKDD